MLDKLYTIFRIYMLILDTIMEGNNLRHGSLQMNVLDMCPKCNHPYLNIKRDINVKKIKVIKQVFFFYSHGFTMKILISLDREKYSL